MKKILAIALAVVALGLCGCRSKKEAAAPAVEPTPLEEVENSLWTNVYAPVDIDILRPMQFSASGRITMVRGESIYLSVRMFGMEVANAFATPAAGVVSLRMPKKLAMEIPMEQVLARAGVSLTDLQEALLGNSEALAKLPPSVSWNVDATEHSSAVEIHTTYAGKDLALRLTWNLKSAKWNQKEVNQWKAPGADYSWITPAEAMKMAGSMLK